MPRTVRFKKCYKCGNEYHHVDYVNNGKPITNSSPIINKMIVNCTCFKCSYWCWRLEEDKKLINIHNDDTAFRNAILKKLNINLSDITWADMAIGGFAIPVTYSKEGFDKAVKAYCEYVTQYYQNRWYFGKPLLIRENGKLNHYIWHPDKNLFTYYHEVGENLPKNTLLMIDGTLSVLDIDSDTYLTSQGPMPTNFVENIGRSENGLPLRDPSIKPLEPNAVKLSQIEFIDIFHQLPEVHLNEPGAVPQNILKKYFKNL